MPYIDGGSRKKVIAEGPTNGGELNYHITSLLHWYIEEKGLNYATVNEIIGVLECAKLELYRVIAAPYETKKAISNGTVSKLDKKLVNKEII